MAIDSAAKRASVAGVNGPPLFGLRPDATQPQGWRQAAGHGYYGLLVTVPEPEPEGGQAGYAQLLHLRRVKILR